MKDKRGQQALGMSFGMIFSIFLIVVFIFVAFMAVSYFLDIGDSAGVGLFYEELQEAVDDVLSSQEAVRSFDIDLPSGIERVCFANLSAEITNYGEDYDNIERYEVYEANVFLVPSENAENMAWKWIDGIDVSKTVAKSNPYCIDVDEGLTLTKGFYDRLVCFGEDCSVFTDAIGVELRVCQLAENDGNCDMLVFAKGDEYGEVCCNEYELCC
jgi:hypothetical protein